MRIFRQVKSALITLVIVYIVLTIILESIRPLMPLITGAIILAIIVGAIFYRRTRL